MLPRALHVQVNLHLYSRQCVRLQSGASRVDRAFAAYRIRKPETLLEVSVRHAKFKALGRGNFFSASQEGAIRLALCSALPPAAGSTFPQYDYSTKAYVDVSALDIVTIIQSPISQPILLGYSDASVRGGRPVSRRLDIAPAPSAASGGAAGAGAAPPGGAPRPAPPGPISLSITNDTLTFSIALQQQELYLLRNLLGLSIPYLTGWQYQLLPSSFDPAVNMASAAAAQRAGEEGGYDMGEEITATLPPTGRQQAQQGAYSEAPPAAAAAPSFPQRGSPYRR